MLLTNSHVTVKSVKLSSDDDVALMIDSLVSDYSELDWRTRIACSGRLKSSHTVIIVLNHSMRKGAITNS